MRSLPCLTPDLIVGISVLSTTYLPFPTYFLCVKQIFREMSSFWFRWDFRFDSSNLRLLLDFDVTLSRHHFGTWDPRLSGQREGKGVDVLPLLRTESSIRQCFRRGSSPAHGKGHGRGDFLSVSSWGRLSARETVRWGTVGSEGVRTTIEGILNGGTLCGGGLGPTLTCRGGVTWSRRQGDNTVDDVPRYYFNKKTE